MSDISNNNCSVHFYKFAKGKWIDDKFYITFAKVSGKFTRQ